MPLNGPQEKLIEAYFKGGNAKDVKSGIELREILRAIKKIEQEPFNQTGEES